jgi:hypothetical protein
MAHFYTLLGCLVKGNVTAVSDNYLEVGQSDDLSIRAVH